MPHLSVTAEAEAAEAWSVEIGGRVYTAEPVSRPALIRWLAAVERAGADAAKQEAALRLLLRSAFPPKWSYVWRGDPVNMLMDLGIATRERVLESFFAFALPSEMQAGRTPTTSTPLRSSEAVRR